MNILAIISGEYGIRHAENLRANGPKGWKVETWQAPSLLPPVIDYPEDYLPASLPPADLLVSFAEHKGVAELLPEIAQLCGAQAVIAPVDSEAWLPRGLARQLHGWLERAGIACATPKPLCSLTETEYQVTRREKGTVDHPLIAEFARYFGRPAFDITLDPVTRRVTGHAPAGMPSVAAPAMSQSGWWGSLLTRPNSRPGCCTIISPAWPAWESTRISATR
jgi:thymidylate synthase